MCAWNRTRQARTVAATKRTSGFTFASLFVCYELVKASLMELMSTAARPAKSISTHVSSTNTAKIIIFMRSRSGAPADGISALDVEEE